MRTWPQSTWDTKQSYSLKNIRKLELTEFKNLFIQYLQIKLSN